MKKLILLLTIALTFANTAFAQIGSADKDLVFTPITPCRIIDTRLIGGGVGTPIPASSTYSFAAGGLSSYATLGGSATDCGLLTPGLNIAALAVNFVVVSPSAAGYITAFPFGVTRPTASTLNYTAGEVVANSAIVKVSQTSVTWMSVYSLATTHLVADVTGYYSRPLPTALQCINVKNTVAFVVPASGSRSIPDADIAACPAAYTGMSYIWQYAGVGSGGIAVWDNDYGTQLGLSHAPYTTTGNTSISLYLGRRCCRIP